MAQPRILQVVSDADRRGAQVAAADVQEALTKRGWQFRTVALQPGRLDARLDVPVLGPRRFAAETLRALRAETREAGVVIGCGSSTLPACALASLGTGVPFVYRSIGDLPYWTRTRAKRIRVRAELRRTARVVALWQGAADVLPREFGVAPQHVVVIPNGVSGTRFPPVDRSRRPEARRRLDIAADRPTLVVLGALSPEKDVGAAIRVLPALPDCQLVVAGDGPERAPLERLAEEVAPGRVLFTGVVEEPATVFAAADVLVLTSRSEGMPAALIEAGLSGLPCVATDVGGVRDVVRPGETGEVVPPGDRSALADAVRSALDRAESYGAAARRHCLARFEMDVVADAWEELLTRLVRNP